MPELAMDLLCRSCLWPRRLPGTLAAGRDRHEGLVFKFLISLTILLLGLVTPQGQAHSQVPDLRPGIVYSQQPSMDEGFNRQASEGVYRFRSETEIPVRE